MARTANSTNSAVEVTLFDDTVSRLRKCLVLAEGGEPTSQEDRSSPNVDEATSTPMEICDDNEVNAKPSHVGSLNGVVPNAVAKDQGSERIRIVDYESELQISDIMRLITKDLSEPYSIYTYRYFIHNWPNLCLLALDTSTSEYVGAIVCKLDVSRQNRRRGYIAMLAVDESARRLGIGTRLVQQVIANMQATGCDEVVLETEVTNLNAIRLYTNLGFIREKRLFRYYLNGVDAFRLKLFFTPTLLTFDDVGMYTRTQDVSE